MALTKVTYSMIDAPVVNLADFGPAANGTTDDGAKIALAIAATPVNGTLLIPTGNYGVSALAITRSNITIQLEGTLVNITSTSSPPQVHTGSPSYGAPPNEVSNYPALYLNGCTNFTITGNGAINTPWYEAIKAVSCTNLNILGISIYGLRSTNLSSILRGAWDAIWMNTCTNVMIDNIEIYNIGGIRQYVLDQRWSGNPYGVSGDCITINSSTIITIQNCYFHDYAWQAIYPMDCSKVHIINNVVENGTGFCQYNAVGDWSTTPMDYVIDGNMVYNMSGNGLDLSVGSTGITIAAGRITNNSFRYIGYLPDMTGQFDGAYISVNHPTSAYITDLIFDSNVMEQGCVSYGVYLAAVQNCIFSNNVIRNTGQMAFQIGVCANITISNNICQQISTNFITLSSATDNPYIVAEGNIVNCSGYPVVAVGGATANQLKLVENRFVGTTASSIDLSNFVCESNYFQMDMTINGTAVRIADNAFDGAALFRLTNSVVDGNICTKGMTLPDTTTSTISDNVVNKSAGNFNMSIFLGSGAVQPTKLSVIGNIVYANDAGTAISSTATYSVFANVSPDGTNSITGTGTTVLY
jgi:hypothetical protein